MAKKKTKTAKSKQLNASRVICMAPLSNGNEHFRLSQISELVSYEPTCEKLFNYGDYFARNLEQTIDTYVAELRNTSETQPCAPKPSFADEDWTDFRSFVLNSINTASKKYRVLYKNICVPDVIAQLFFDQTGLGEAGEGRYVPWSVLELDRTTTNGKGSNVARAAALWALDELVERKPSEELDGFMTELGTLPDFTRNKTSTTMLPGWESTIEDAVHDGAAIASMTDLIADALTLSKAAPVNIRPDTDSDMYADRSRQWLNLCNHLGESAINGAVAYVNETVDRLYDHIMKMVSLCIEYVIKRKGLAGVKTKEGAFSDNSGALQSTSRCEDNADQNIRKWIFGLTVEHFPILTFWSMDKLEPIVPPALESEWNKRFVIDDPYKFLFGLAYMDIQGLCPAYVSGPYLTTALISYFELPWVQTMGESLTNYEMLRNDTELASPYEFVAVETLGDRKWMLNYAQMVYRFGKFVPARRQNAISQEFMDRWNEGSNKYANRLIASSPLFKKIVLDSQIRTRNVPSFNETLCRLANRSENERKLASILRDLTSDDAEHLYEVLSGIKDGKYIECTLDEEDDAEMQVDTSAEAVESGLEQKPQEPQESGASRAEMKAKIKALQKELRDVKADLKASTEKIGEMEDESEMARQELIDLRNIVFREEEDDGNGDGSEGDGLDELEDSGMVPYHTKKRIVVFGGHDSWRKKVRELLPDAKLIPREMIPRSDQIRGADVIWIQANSIRHAFFWKVVGVAKTCNIPIRYFATGGWKQCVNQIVQADGN